MQDGVVAVLLLGQLNQAGYHTQCRIAHRQQDQHLQGRQHKCCWLLTAGSNIWTEFVGTASAGCHMHKYNYGTSRAQVFICNRNSHLQPALTMSKNTWGHTISISCKVPLSSRTGQATPWSQKWATWCSCQAAVALRCSLLVAQQHLFCARVAAAVWRPPDAQRVADNN